MRYAYEFIVPKGTPVTEPYQESVRLSVGTLTAIEVRFRAGCHQRVTFRVRDGLWSLLPAAEGAALYGDNVIFHIPMQYRLTEKPYELTLEGTSAGCDYDHTLSVWFDVQEETPADRHTLAGLMQELGSEE